MHADPSVDSFRCPLRAACFLRSATSFESRSQANEAVASYQACSCSEARAEQAEALFERHLLLMRKALGGFCRQSGCYPGACLPEELLGDTFPIFLRVLDEYEPSFGLDFLGYASQRVRWALQHRARGYRRAQRRATEEIFEEYEVLAEPERRALDRILTEELLGRLPIEDADLIRLKYAFGYSTGELSERFGVSGAALRKRCERARKRLREDADSESDVSHAAEA